VPQDEPLKMECAHFLECMETRERPRTDGEEGLRVLQVLNASQQSLEQEKAVPLSQDSGPDYFCHETAVVDQGVAIGKGTKIWHFSHVLSGSTIGEKCNIGQNVVVGPKAVIGNGCKIQNNISVYEDVILEDNVFCGPSMVFTNVYNPRSEFPRKREYRGTLVKRGATLGANCTIVCGTTIGQYAFIAAGAVVNRDVSDFALVAGNPAKQIGWMSRFGEQLGLSLHGSGEYECPHTGEKYTLRNGEVTICK